MADASLATSWHLDRRIAAALENATDADPFAVLGPHDTPDGRVVRAFVPGALGVEVLKRADRAPLGCLDRCGIEGLFEGLVSDAEPYLLRISRPGGVQDTEDAYAFGALLGELDLHLFNEGRHFELADAFAQTMACRACALRYGHPMRGGSQSSAISIPGIPGAIRCACATRPACGSFSCRASARGRATNTTS
jgi:hypothetical protein